MSHLQVLFLTPISLKIAFKTIHQSIQNVEFIQSVGFIEPLVYKPLVSPLVFLTVIYFVFFLWARVGKMLSSVSPTE